MYYNEYKITKMHLARVVSLISFSFMVKYMNGLHKVILWYAFEVCLCCFVIKVVVELHSKSR